MADSEFTSTRAVVLRRVAYRDSRAMVTLLTREAGLVAVSVTVGKSTASRRRNALLMPGSRVEVLLRYLPSRSASTLMDVGVADMAVPLGSATSLAMTMFVCEVTSALLREASADRRLFDFVDATFALISSGGNMPNLPIAYLIGMMSFIGIEPDSRLYRPGMFFDFSGGTFTPEPPISGRWLERDESHIAAQLLRMNYRNMAKFRFNREQRASLIDRLLDYYTIHFTPMLSLRTLPVLHQLFD